MTEFRGRARFWAYLTTAVVCLVVAAPFAWIFINSIKNQIDIYTGTLSFTPVWTNYHDLLFGRRSDFLLNVRNSALVASASTIFVMIIGTLAAYSLSRFRFARWFAAGCLAWTLIFHMIPPITLVGPWYLTFRELGLFNTLTGLVLTRVTINLPMTVWLMMSFFQDVPKELEEAALIDGCRRVGAFLRVSLPLAVPGLVAAGILAFIFSWNEFSIALKPHHLRQRDRAGGHRPLRPAVRGAPRRDGLRLAAGDRASAGPDVRGSALHREGPDPRLAEIAPTGCHAWKRHRHPARPCCLARALGGAPARAPWTVFL